MDIKKIIKEELQDQYGVIRYLWVSSDEKFFVNGEAGMLSPTEELDYDTLITNSLPTEEEAHNIFNGGLRHNWVHYVTDYDAWETAPITQEMFNDLKLVTWFVGAVKDSEKDVFDQLSESNDFDWVSDILKNDDSVINVGDKVIYNSKFSYPKQRLCIVSDKWVGKSAGDRRTEGKGDSIFYDIYEITTEGNHPTGWENTCVEIWDEIHRKLEKVTSLKG
jgi:hypothetical protein